MKPLLNTTDEELTKLGINSFEAKTNPSEVYRKMFDLSLEAQCGRNYNIYYGKKWAAFYAGWHQEYVKHLKQQRIDLKVDEFLEKLQKLCNEYNTTIYANYEEDGCSCIDDYYFPINIKPCKN